MNPILNAEEFQRAVSFFGGHVENLSLQQRWFGESVGGLDTARREFTDTVNRLIRAMGMQAENDVRKHRGEAMAYDEAAFQQI